MSEWYRPYRRFENAAKPQWRPRRALAANFETTDNNKHHESRDAYNRLKMNENRKKQCYSIKFKLVVISYAKTRGNRAAARNFGPNGVGQASRRIDEETSFNCLGSISGTQNRSSDEKDNSTKNSSSCDSWRPNQPVAAIRCLNKQTI